MKTLHTLINILLLFLIFIVSWIDGYYRGKERTFKILQDNAAYGTNGISGGHYTNDSFERVDSMDFGAFKCLMTIKYDGNKIEWDYSKEYNRN